MPYFEPEVVREKQKQLDYCIYMMVSSLFKKANLKNNFLERRLYLSYQSMKIDKQVKLEEQVIYAIEHYLIRKLPKNHESLEVEVALKKYKEQTAIYFSAPSFSCVVIGNYIDDYMTKIRLTCITDKDKKRQKENKNQVKKGVWVEL